MNNYVLIWGDWLSCDPFRGSHYTQSPHIRKHFCPSCGNFDLFVTKLFIPYKGRSPSMCDFGSELEQWRTRICNLLLLMYFSCGCPARLSSLNVQDALHVHIMKSITLKSLTWSVRKPRPDAVKSKLRWLILSNPDNRSRWAKAYRWNILAIKIWFN